MATSPRLRRLLVDWTSIKELAERSPYVEILQTSGNPPQMYELGLQVRGIIGLNPDQTPRYGENHKIRITLGEEYPRAKPIFEILTKVWHPNIGWGEGVLICIGSEGDHGWAPSMGLDDIVLRIMHMIRYENYSCDDNYNMLAAEWARKHENIFPLDTSDFLEELLDIDIIIDEDDPLLDDEIVIS